MAVEFGEVMLVYLRKWPMDCVLLTSPSLALLVMHASRTVSPCGAILLVLKTLDEEFPKVL